MKKIVLISVSIVLLLCLVISGIFGYHWYQSNHVFVGENTYPINSQKIDLREEKISFDEFNRLCEQLPDCEILWMVPFQGEQVSSDSTSLAIKELTEEDISILTSYFPKLERIDTSACQNYAELELLKAQRPELTIDYRVSLGGTAFPADATELTLNSGDYEYSTMTLNLKYMPQLKSIQFEGINLTIEQLSDLQTAFPGIAMMYSVDILGQLYNEDTVALDLSAMRSADTQTICGKLALLPNLKTVELADADGKSNLAVENVLSLMAASPKAAFHYCFDFYGEVIATDAKEVYVKNKTIGNDGENEVRQALDLMQDCDRFVLDNCQISNEIMVKIREDYRNKTKVVWRVNFGRGSTLTDVEVIRSTYDLVDDNCQNLIYCEDVKYLDIGHNEYLDAVPFIEGMPDLEVAIVSGAPIKDLTPFANCKKLKVLEIAYCSYIDDLSPIASCDALEMLNISYTHVTDLAPVDSIPLTHLCAVSPSARIPAEEQQRFNEMHPDCWTQYIGDQPYGKGWRYSEDGKQLEWYEQICRIFGYPHALNNAGWYVDKD